MLLRAECIATFHALFSLLAGKSFGYGGEIGRAFLYVTCVVAVCMVEDACLVL